ncbi:hypothetical protein EXU85_09380 [Spirosoma sp. KCTC 42546]|uniref:hypothetical protein n=1 Tax=Spirosoma sp. KCTC 42546 TaxID=2520506 RepID=UPI0011578EC3|nr:hypothetical protein [Spirosoma sp. KCTC 42546]QDK78805.1 hypothetical protein EXU85_09380 [Spirosoma sp. KCTC 42546]
MSNPTGKQNPVVLYIGSTMIILCLITIFTLSNKIDKTLFYFILSGVFAVGVSMLASVLSGRITYKNAKIKATGSFAILIILLLYSIYFYSHQNKTFDFTIYLLDKSKQLAIRDGMLQIRFRNAPREEKIDSHGSAYFRGISSDLQNDTVQVEILGETGWQFVNKSRTADLLLQGDHATLIVEPDNSRCCLSGTVINQYNRLVSGADLWVKSSKVSKSNNEGQFIIELPLDLQNENSFELFIRKGKYENRVIVNRIQNPTLRITED